MNNPIQKKGRSCYENLKISKELRDLIHGYIMSDGYVSLSGNLTVYHSQKQAKFVNWLYKKFEPIRTQTSISKIERRDVRTNKTYSSLRFNTRNLLHGFRSMWYAPCMNHLPCSAKAVQIKYQKGLPKSLSCFFSPVFISIWYAGDGTKIQGSKGVKFEVTAFTPEERQILKNLFQTKYDISAVINRAGVSKSGNTQWALCINASEYPKFKALITQIDLIPTLFPYKLH